MQRIKNAIGLIVITEARLSNIKGEVIYTPTFGKNLNKQKLSKLKKFNN